MHQIDKNKYASGHLNILSNTTIASKTPCARFWTRSETRDKNNLLQKHKKTSENHTSILRNTYNDALCPKKQLELSYCCDGRALLHNSIFAV